METRFVGTPSILRKYRGRKFSLRSLGAWAQNKWRLVIWSKKVLPRRLR